MPTINQLSPVSRVQNGDLLPLYVSDQGGVRQVSVNTLMEFFKGQFVAPGYDIQTQVPLTGFNLSVNVTSEITWLLLQPLGSLASGTITLPSVTGLPNGSELLVTTTQQISSLAVANNGAAAVNGAPSSMSANDSFRLKYVTVNNSWYLIG